MTREEDTDHLEQQFEGQEHDFLGYRATDVHFIYSFAWDTMRVPWTKLTEELREKGWAQRRLHERSLNAHRGGAGPTYQPNLVTQASVLEKIATIAPRALVLAPVVVYHGQSLGECLRIPVCLEYTVRLFDNGGGICTLVARIGEDESSFQAIHSILRLASNVDRGESTEAEAETHQHLTASYLDLESLQQGEGDHSLIPLSIQEAPTLDHQYVTLHDLFRRFLTAAVEWLPDAAPELWIDSEVLDTGDVHQDFQTPFIFTVAEVERNSFLRFRKHPSIDHAREIASIVCKLTLDNRFVRSDYLHLSEDYIRAVLPFNESRGGLLNLCLDRRLFFTTSRRGAIALTASRADVPSFFVLPSFVNLLEILRLRWHLSCIVGARLDRAISSLVAGVDQDPLDLVRNLFRWRAMFGAFLRDPMPVLFDGGSVTDIAEIAEKQHWLPRLLVETERKLDCLERLVGDRVNIQRWEEMELYNAVRAEP